jgi:hypothetical protein
MKLCLNESSKIDQRNIAHSATWSEFNNMNVAHTQESIRIEEITIVI